MLKILLQSDEFFSQLKIHIEKANHSIDFEFYNIDPDEYGLHILKKLKEKEEQGVTVRLIIDGFGSLALTRYLTLNPHLKLKNMKIFNPLPEQVDKSKNPFLNFFKLIFNYKRLNRRDHRKLAIFDQRQAIIGSFNIAKRQMQWKEIGVVTDFLFLETLKDTYEFIWQKSHPRQKKLRSFLRIRFSKEFKNVLTNFSRRERKKKIQFLKQSLRSAEKKIFISTPYFYPPRDILKILKTKKEGGLDIKIILPNQSDIIISKWANESFYPTLKASGIEIFEYQPQFMHQKYMIIDDTMLIGSSNLNQRSFFRDYETDIVFDSSSTDVDFNTIFERDLKQSSPVEPSEFQRMIPLKQAFVFIFSFLKGWF